MSETRPEGTEDLRRRSAQPTLVFQCGLTFVGLELVIVGLLGEEKKKKKADICGAGRDNSQRPRVWFQGLLDMNTPSSSG